MAYTRERKHAFVSPCRRFLHHYYFDEFIGEWFYIPRVNTDENFWYMQCVRHTLNGWEKIGSWKMYKNPLNGRHFATQPFVVSQEDLQR